MAPGANAARLDAAVQAIENLEKQVENLKKTVEKAEKISQVAQARIAVLEEENSVILKRLKVLEKSEGIVLVATKDQQETEGAVTGLDGTGPEPPPAGGEEDAEDVLAVSKKAGDSKPIKELVTILFNHLMGTDSVKPRDLPLYPFGIDPTNESWPKSERGTPLTRFNWDKSADSGINKVGIEAIFNLAKSNGADHCPAAKSGLEKIQDVHLRGRIVTKFKYYAREWKKSKKPLQEAAEDDNDEEFEDADSTSKPLQDRAHKNTRATSKLAARERKRGRSEYTDPKYNSAFTINAMSDDEDDPERIPSDPIQYISRIPSYRSELVGIQVQRIYDDVDKIPDPDPDKAKKMTRRVRGTIKECDPPAAKHIRNKIRVWQVKPELLDQNKHWLENGRIVASGIAWGDDADPVEADERDMGRKRGSSMDDEGHRTKVIVLDEVQDSEASAACVPAGLEQRRQQLAMLRTDPRYAEVFTE
ncbi:hypothetical protein OE88DRAFT_1810278 [Heliocybe sulcata]|uniref:Uncharacterized protein n=1 Tax=Heliocybe sulcata TaxID=5364 RepID=A0A5C3MTH3_9AGAM|nr:hypothetical protein OE88DRAFT_1810278 [Heliocybe sulcata]